MVLAGHLGMTLRECQQRVGSDEFTKWLAFNEIDPIGGYRGDRQVAKVCQTLYRVNGGKGDELAFLPRYDDPPAGILKRRIMGLFTTLAAVMPLKPGS